MSSHVALITGVSSGIGKCILVRLLQNHYSCIGIVRNEEKKTALLAELTNTLPPELLSRLTLRCCDLRNASEIEAVSHSIRAEVPFLDTLVMNAGVGFYGPHEELSVSAITDMTAVNFTAPLLFTNLFLRDLKQHNGRILFLSSVTARKTDNTHGCAYGATKAGLSGFASSLFAEVRKYGVHVTVLSPDLTATDLYRNAPFCADASEDASLTPEEVAEYAMTALSVREGMNLTEIIMQPQRHRLGKHS